MSNIIVQIPVGGIEKTVGILNGKNAPRKIVIYIAIIATAVAASTFAFFL